MTIRFFTNCFTLYRVTGGLFAYGVGLLLAHAVNIPFSSVNPFTSFAIIVGCIGLLLSHVCTSPIRLWYPLPWFLLTTALYYGIGPLLYAFGTQETVIYVDLYYRLDEEGLWRVNALTLIGVITVLTAYGLSNRLFACRVTDPTSRCIADISTGTLRRISLVFCLIGIPIKALFVLPRALGLWQITLPGSFETLATLSMLSLVPLFLLYRRSAGLVHVSAFFALVAFELVTATMELSKFAILKVAIVILLAWVLQGGTIKRLFLPTCLLVFVYITVLTPLITYGRHAFRATGLQNSSDIVTLVRDFTAGKAADQWDKAFFGVQGWWVRLNYANAQGFAMAAFDRGQSGDTFPLALWIIVPRFIYPEKPIMTTGSRFNVLVNGNPDSKSAPGMLAEGYWNAGWFGLLLVSSVLGVLFSLWESYTKIKFNERRLQFLPVIWMGILPGMRQDSWFIPGTVGLTVIAIGFHWLIRLTRDLSGSRRLVLEGRVIGSQARQTDDTGDAL